jgi:hypothetical protein
LSKTIASDDDAVASNGMVEEESLWSARSKNSGSTKNTGTVIAAECF